MRCEVVAIGTELLLGQIHDTNSAWIGEQLALAGIDSLYQTKVGDNFDRIVGEFQNGTMLKNEGEQLLLTAVGGETVRDVTYDNKAPWPEAPCP